MVSCIPNVQLQLKTVVAIVFFRILQLISFATPLAFNYTNFSPNNHNLYYQRSAISAHTYMQLTGNRNFTIGRVTYDQPLQLWDRFSGNLTDFSTNFSFIIDSQNRPNYSDGLAFFLSGSRIPPGTMTITSNLGLSNDHQASNSTHNPFFAVEFDVFSNLFDPPYNHVGIDINSLASNETVEWLTGDSIIEGREHEARINYDSSSNNLTVNFTGLQNGSYVMQSLSFLVDFRLVLPELVYFGFSAATGNYPTVHNIDSWNFSSNLDLQTNVTLGLTNPGNNKKRLAIGFVVGGLVFVIICIGWIIYFFWKRRKGETNKVNKNLDLTLSGEFEKGSGPKKFLYNDLAQATNNFAEREMLGQGGFGGVYKGFLKDIDLYVAVKRVSRGSWQGLKEYVSEVKIISLLRHKNLVQIIGWCHEKQELLLVYEFMPNGSLDYHLFKGKSLLAWGTRFKITQGLASALLYLHEELEQCAVHRDIKSSNIMLDANFNAKLGDFGLARLVDHEKGSQTTVLAGTMGYMAPECSETGKATKETDVFSFGVVALEIACGRKPIDSKAELSRMYLVEWVWNLYGTGKILEATDPRLDGEFSTQEMEQLMIVGLWCAHPDCNQRPSIRQAVRVLNFESPLPVLPARRPIPIYCTPTSSACVSIVSDSCQSYSDKIYPTFSATSSSSTNLHTKS